MASNQVRVIAYNALYVGKLRTVNIVSSGADSKIMPTCTQLTANQAKVGIHPTIMAAPAATRGLPYVCIPGYSGPN